MIQYVPKMQCEDVAAASLGNHVSVNGERLAMGAHQHVGILAAINNSAFE